MNGTSPPPMPGAPAKKSGMPTWAIVLIIVGGVGLVGVFMIGLLAAIAIPNFVKARTTAQTNMCINQLRQIDSAKHQWALENKKEGADTPTQSEITSLLKDGQFPMCPAGGTYTINAVDQAPACSMPNHQLRPGPAPPNR